MSGNASALRAIARYEQCAQDVHRLTRGIGEAINRCDVSRQVNDEPLHWQERDRLMDGARVKTHLWAAYHETTDADAPYPSERQLLDFEQEEYLQEAGCQHCLEAWRLVQERKQARKSYGAAKRAIRQLGKTLLAKATGEPE